MVLMWHLQQGKIELGLTSEIGARRLPGRKRMAAS
jgi:hypothetical protein